MRGLGQRQEMEIMTVHASIRNQAEQMQTMVARFLEAIWSTALCASSPAASAC